MQYMIDDWLWLTDLLKDPLGQAAAAERVQARGRRHRVVEQLHAYGAGERSGDRVYGRDGNSVFRLWL
jgi:hypothetical protein